MKRLSLLVIAAASTLVLSAPSFAQPTGDTLKKIKETGTITLGYRESSVPFSFLDAQQKPVGLSMDICQAIVEKVKQQLNLPKLEVKEVAVPGDRPERSERGDRGDRGDRRAPAPAPAPEPAPAA